MLGIAAVAPGVGPNDRADPLRIVFAAAMDRDRQPVAAGRRVREPHARRFFVGEAIAECVPFRVTRNADISVREDAASDLLAGMEEVLDERRHADCVRLEIDQSASPLLLGFLRSALGIDKAEAFSLPGPLDLAAWSTLSDRLVLGEGGFIAITVAVEVSTGI